MLVLVFATTGLDAGASHVFDPIVTNGRRGMTNIAASGRRLSTLVECSYRGDERHRVAGTSATNAQISLASDLLVRSLR